MQFLNSIPNRVLVAAMTTALGAMIGFAPCSFAGKFANNHPRRAEVVGRTNVQKARLNENRGDLGGHYGQLKREDNSIHRQERRDARENGGFITKGQQAHLNKEENSVNRQIKADKTN